MITIEEHEFKTPIGIVSRATLLVDGKVFLSYENTKGSSNAIQGLILSLGKFKIEALNVIHKHIMDTEDTP